MFRSLSRQLTTTTKKAAGRYYGDRKNLNIPKFFKDLQPDDHTFISKGDDMVHERPFPDAVIPQDGYSAKKTYQKPRRSYSQYTGKKFFQLLFDFCRSCTKEIFMYNAYI